MHYLRVIFHYLRFVAFSGNIYRVFCAALRPRRERVDAGAHVAGLSWISAGCRGRRRRALWRDGRGRVAGEHPPAPPSATAAVTQFGSDPVQVPETTAS